MKSGHQAGGGEKLERTADGIGERELDVAVPEGAVGKPGGRALGAGREQRVDARAIGMRPHSPIRRVRMGPSVPPAKARLDAPRRDPLTASTPDGEKKSEEGDRESTAGKAWDRRRR